MGVIISFSQKESIYKWEIRPALSRVMMEGRKRRALIRSLSLKGHSEAAPSGKHWKEGAHEGGPLRGLGHFFV